MIKLDNINFTDSNNSSDLCHMNFNGKLCLETEFEDGCFDQETVPFHLLQTIDAKSSLFEYSDMVSFSV